MPMGPRATAGSDDDSGNRQAELHEGKAERVDYERRGKEANGRACSLPGIG